MNKTHGVEPDLRMLDAKRSHQDRLNQAVLRVKHEEVRHNSAKLNSYVPPVLGEDGESSSVYQIGKDGIHHTLKSKYVQQMHNAQAINMDGCEYPEVIYHSLIEAFPAVDLSNFQAFLSIYTTLDGFESLHSFGDMVSFANNAFDTSVWYEFDDHVSYLGTDGFVASLIAESLRSELSDLGLYPLLVSKAKFNSVVMYAHDQYGDDVNIGYEYNEKLTHTDNVINLLNTLYNEIVQYSYVINSLVINS